MVQSISKSCEHDYRQLASSRPWLLFLDNLNIYYYVRQVVLNRRGHQDHKIGGFVLFPQKPDGTPSIPLDRGSLDRSKAAAMTPKDLLMSREDIRYFEDVAMVHYGRVLQKYLPDGMRKLREYTEIDDTGKRRTLRKKLPVPPQIRPLNNKNPSKLLTLPVLNLKETDVSNR